MVGMEAWKKQRCWLDWGTDLLGLLGPTESPAATRWDQGGERVCHCPKSWQQEAGPTQQGEGGVALGLVSPQQGHRVE